MAGEGFPWWMELDRRRPADDLAAAVPHQRARVLDARLGRRAREPRRCCPRFSASTLPRRRPPLRRDRVQRDRRDARDPHAPARAPRRRRQPAAPLLHGPVARPRSASSRSRSASASRSCAATRCRRRRTALIWRARHAAVRHARLAAPAPDARPRQRGARDARRRPVAPARSASSSCATRRSCAATARCPRRPRRCCCRRLAAHRRPRARTTPTRPTRSSAARRR